MIANVSKRRAERASLRTIIAKAHTEKACAVTESEMIAFADVMDEHEARLRMLTCIDFDANALPQATTNGGHAVGSRS